ncbi:hypothetical protein [Paraburkholderia acidicola]|uniref:hypothetical protein n=1 Tax=Paraburkholderia acidicola TaxID=1912599 RepID=UPI0038B2F751
MPFTSNAAWLAGKPDVVFTKVRFAIFIDGDFWHGWKFEQWSHKLAPYWREEIAENRARDLRHMARQAAECRHVLPGDPRRAGS